SCLRKSFSFKVGRARSCQIVWVGNARRPRRYFNSVDVEHPGKKRQGAGALQDAIASQRAQAVPPGFGLRQPSAAFGGSQALRSTPSLTRHPGSDLASMFGAGCWMLDVGCSMLDVRCWMFDVPLFRLITLPCATPPVPLPSPAEF